MQVIGEIRRENLERLIEQFGTMDALASEVGTSPIYLSQIKNRTKSSKSGRRREMGTALARRLEAALGKPDGWMDQDHSQDWRSSGGSREEQERGSRAWAAGSRHAPRSAPTDSTQWTDSAGEAAPSPAAAASAYRPRSQVALEEPPRQYIATRPDIHFASNDDFPAVRRVRLKLQAGVSGWAVEDVEDGPPVVFRKDWFAAHNYQPDKLLACRVQGASMEPTLYDGDLVVVNTAQRAPQDGRCFAMNYEGTMAIKRLVRDAGEWIIRSDNPDKIRYSDKKAHESVSLIGEIIYRQSERI